MRANCCQRLPRMTCFLLFNLLFIYSQQLRWNTKWECRGENHPDKAPFGLMWHQLHMQFGNSCLLNDYCTSVTAKGYLKDSVHAVLLIPVNLTNHKSSNGKVQIWSNWLFHRGLEEDFMVSAEEEIKSASHWAEMRLCTDTPQHRSIFNGVT